MSSAAPVGHTGCRVTSRLQVYGNLDLGGYFSKAVDSALRVAVISVTSSNVAGLSGASLALLVNSVVSFNRVSSSAPYVGLELTESYLTGCVPVLY